MLDIGGSISIHGVTLTRSCLLQIVSLQSSWTLCPTSGLGLSGVKGDCPQE